MHVCFLTHEYPLPGVSHGGVGTMVKIISQKLVQRGYKVSVVGEGYHNDNVYNIDGVVIYTLKKSTWKFARFIDISRRINSLLKRINEKCKIDIIETPENGLAFINKCIAAKMVIRMNGGHHFFTVAEKRPRELWKVIQEKRSFKKADGIAAVSSYVAETTKKYIKIYDKIDVIYNPVDVNIFREANRQATKKNQILFVGTLCEKKGIRQLVQAMPFVKEHFPYVHLKIVGRDWKCPRTGQSYKSFLERSIDQSVKENISFYGTVSNYQLPSIIEQAEICVFPSHMEAMPLAWLEALAMGKPVVGSKEGPGEEAIIDGETGLLADPHNPKDIADKIIYLLKNKDVAISLGEKARKDILKRFDIEKCIEKNILFYKKIVQQTNIKN